MTNPCSPYVDWLQRRGITLYKSDNTYWRLYGRALIPASTAPCFVVTDNDEAKTLLCESGASLLRYSSDPSCEETDWWYIVCDAFDPRKLSPKIRQNINRGRRNCSVTKIQPRWLADNGFLCYRSAYQRYKNAAPAPQERFKNALLSTVGGPFEYWGVFVGDRLAGYVQCIVEGKVVNTSSTKYDPAYLKLRTAYSLVDSVIRHYVVERGMVISNGNRALLHDTNYQEFLVNLGFRRQFCRLNVVYKPWVEVLIRAAFPLKRVLNRLPDAGLIHPVKALLFQEQVRRVCLERQ